MELQALLVLCGVGVAGIAVVLLMGLFSASGTSYEEAIAQQRRATTELLALADNKSKAKKTNKKANKKLAKKEKNKDNAAAATASEPESEAPAESGVEDEPAPAAKPHVEFSPPVVVEVAADTPPNIKIRKRGKDSKVKPILLNKEDPSCISDPSTLPPSTENTVSNHFEEMQPKDDFELLHSTLVGEKSGEKKEEVVEKKDSKVAKPAKTAKAPVKQPAPEPVKDEGSRERQNTTEPPNEQRKVKKVEKKPVEEPKQEEEVVPPLNVPQPSELTTEKLLKQALPPVAAPAPSPPGKGKKKKPEPNVLALMAGEGGNVAVSELVRVVRDAALSRTEIQILTDALLNKHHDQLPEHSEWTEGPNDPIQKLKKQLADKEKALADEIETHQGANNMLKELRATLAAERAKASAAARAGEAQAAAMRAELNTLQKRLARLVDESSSLAHDNSVLQSKLSAEGEAQAQRVQLEMHIQRLSEAEAALLAQLAALQAELSARVLEAGQARCEAAAARDTLLMAQQHAADIAQQLQEANRACSELEAQRQCAAHAEQQAQQERGLAQERVAALTEEVQRLTTRAQTAESSLEKLKEESDKQIQQLSSELSSLGEQMAAREAELAELRQLRAVPAQNGLPPANDEQKGAELAKVESVVEALRSELAAAQRGGGEQRAQLAALADQLDHYKQKNNEAIAKAQETQYNEVASVLRAACPAACPSVAAGREWLQAFADNLKKELEKKESEKKLLEKEIEKKLQEKDNERKQLQEQMEKKLREKDESQKEMSDRLQRLQREGESEKKRFEAELEKVAVPPQAASGDSDARLKELVAQNDHLQGVVDKYKRIIDDTEGVLSRLQQNVTREEQRWARQLADKQHELDDLRQRTIMQMQKKIDALQAELQQKQSNYSNSFADAERLNQERFADLTGKDVHNGPFQVELDDK
ncbi:uncharacterized protein alt isoform X2 [Epargyreus clarus]|uniref:uncharacterized protein alt isoform X2 n=1 Tax=Epargyreus clarus TaxID=520877 RepID=UPI003C2DEA6E